MNTEMKKVDQGALFAGSILLAVGALMLVDRFTSLEFGDLVRRHWPLVIVGVGLPRLFSRDTVWSGLWMLALGTWLQFAHLRLFGLTYRNSWPLLLIVLGAGTILRALVDVIVPKEETHER